MKNNILILGHGDHGKTSVALYLSDRMGLSCRDSSEFAAEHTVFPVLGGKYGYSNWKQCHADRRNHRDEWGDLIADYNRHDPTRLAKELLRQSEVYVGMRRWREFIPSLKQGLFSDVIWVDATGRKNLEPYTSMEFDFRSVEGLCKVWGAKIWFISNQGPEKELYGRVEYVSSKMRGN